jgi:hypothetical protein
MEVAPGAWDLLTAYHCSSSIMSERNSGTIKSLILYAPGILDDSVNACLKQWKEASYARAVSFLSGGYCFGWNEILVTRHSAQCSRPQALASVLRCQESAIF